MKSEERFTDTVSDYVKYRPHYPNALLPLLTSLEALKQNDVIADIGSGTGILTADFLKAGHKTYGVEPNQAMRKAAEKALSTYAHFISLAGSAESTGLEASSIDLITIATAFHWLDPLKTKKECCRVLKSGGHVALIWNIRDIYASPLMHDYEKLLQQYAIEYEKLASQDYDESIIHDFYAPAPYLLETLPNKQVFDKAGLIGRVLSTAYAPRDNPPQLDKLIKAMQDCFDMYQSDGEVEFLYQTKIYLGQVK